MAFFFNDHLQLQQQQQQQLESIHILNNNQDSVAIHVTDDCRSASFSIIISLIYLMIFHLSV